MIFPYATSPGDTIITAVAKVAEALFYPVLIAALLAGLVVLYELGRLGVEAWKRSQKPTEADLREVLSGHICRCTGYAGIVAALMEAAGVERDPSGKGE